MCGEPHYLCLRVVSLMSVNEEIQLEHSLHINIMLLLINFIFLRVFAEPQGVVQLTVVCAPFLHVSKHLIINAKARQAHTQNRSGGKQHV